MKSVVIKLNPTRQQSKILRDLTINSQKVYIAAMREAAEYYSKNQKFSTYVKLTDAVKSMEEYKLLPLHSARRIVRLAGKDFKNDIAGKYNPNKKFDNPLNNTFNLLYSNERVKVKDGTITLGGSKYYQQKYGKSKLQFPFDILDYKDHKEVILEPFGNGKYFKLNIKYDTLPKKSIPKKDSDGIVYEPFKKFEMGHLYHYTYDPKWKDILSFYDGKPLIFFIGNKDATHFYGLNIHFLPMKLREKIMREIKFRTDGKAYNGSIITGLSSIKPYFPYIIRMYLSTHIRSKVQAIALTESNLKAVKDFPTAKYYKKSSDEIFKLVLSQSNQKRKRK